MMRPDPLTALTFISACEALSASHRAPERERPAAIASATVRFIVARDALDAVEGL